MGDVGVGCVLINLKALTYMGISLQAMIFRLVFGLAQGSYCAGVRLRRPASLDLGH